MCRAQQPAYSCNVVLEYDHNIVAAFSDGQLAGLAQQEMERDYNKRRPRDYPGIHKLAVISVIAIGSRIYVAFFIKSSNYIINYEHEKSKAFDQF